MKLKKNLILVLFLILLILIMLFLSKSFNYVFLIAGIILGLFLRYEYFYFGLGLISNLNFLSNVLVFFYGLPYGSLIFYRKKKKYLVYSLILFSTGLLSYFLNYNLLSLSAGGLTGILILKVYKFFK